MKWATGMFSELNNRSLRLSYIPWNGEKLDTYWLHNISSRLIKSIANSKSFIFICRSSWIHTEFTYYICALAPCQHRQCLESEVHISTFMPSLQATGSSLTPCPHQYRDQQSTSIFHLLWLPTSQSISPHDDSSYPEYQATLIERRWWWVGAWSESPKGFISTFHETRAQRHTPTMCENKNLLKWVCV